VRFRTSRSCAVSFARRIMLWAPLLILLALGAPDAVGPVAIGQNAATMDQAHRDGVQTANSGKDRASAIPDQQPTAETLPAYQGTPSDLSALYGSGDHALNSAGNNAALVQEYSVVRSGDANAQRIDPHALDDIKQLGASINSNPGAMALGLNTSGKKGQCQQITTNAPQTFYEASCNKGAAVNQSTPSCAVTLDHHFTNSYQYSCTELFQTGKVCVGPPGNCIARIPVNQAYASACGAFAAQGSTCSLNGASAEVIGVGTITGVTGDNQSVMNLANKTYACTSEVQGSTTGPAYAPPSGYGGQEARVNYYGPTLTKSYLGSTQNAAACASIGSTSCPAGYTLQGPSCVTITPASISYNCPSGWTLSGMQCSQNLVQPAPVAGYTCPSGYTLNATICSQFQAAALRSYTCPSGYTLSGTSCSQMLTQPTNLTGYICPSSFTVSGSNCSQTLSQSATPAYACPNGRMLTGTNCAQATSEAATPNYSCPVGWLLSGSICAANINYESTASYSCPSGFALAGTICSGTNVTAASLIQDCEGLSSSGGYCVSFNGIGGCSGSYGALSFDHKQSQSIGAICYYRPNFIYTCQAGYTLSGTNCIMAVSQMAHLSYSCQGSDTLTAATCNGTANQAASLAYSCPGGTTLSGTNCAGSANQSASVTWSCPASWTLSGSSCSQTIILAATPSYTCPADYTLSGSGCTQLLALAATAIYSCPSGFAQAGSQCTSTIQANPTGYACPPDYSLTDLTCTHTLSQTASSNYNCGAGQSLSGSNCLAYASPVGGAGTSCTNQVDVCTDSAPQTRMITSFEITQSCWGWNRSYSCTSVTTGNSDCADLQNNPKCSFEREQCLDDPPNGPCHVTEEIYKCPVPGSQGPPLQQLVCGGDIYCVNGTCDQIQRDASSELKDALIAMGAVNQAQKDFDGSNLALFKGTRETCHKPIFGLVNCCAGKVSGALSYSTALLGVLAGNPFRLASIATQFLTLLLCSNSEKMLDVKDRMGLCHFVGSYCTSSFLGICATVRHAYCCFQSKLTRILHEQGRPQIGKPWGAPKTEQCAGFTPDEFAQLDLSKMDFSEIYADFLASARLPDEVQMASDIQTKIQAYYQQHQQSGR
jgi:conjugal transfer mating pair stabilization protein TraN